MATAWRFARGASSFPTASATSWDADWEKIWKAAYNYYFVSFDHSGGIHNTGYAVGLLRASLEDLGAAAGGVDYTAAP